MDVLVRGKAFDRYGGGPAEFGVVGALLTQSLGDYGPGLRQIEITAFFRSDRQAPQTLPELYDEHHRQMAALPVVKFFRKKGRATIDYATALTDATIYRRRPLSAEFFARVYDEIAAQLRLLGRKIGPGVPFDMERLHQDVSPLHAKFPPTDDALRDLAWDLNTTRLAKIAAMDPFERLDVDWSAFHPKARELLNRPFFWEQADDASPHGNDTGADTFAEYRTWTCRQPGRPAHQLAEVVVGAWGFPAIDWTETGEEKVRAIIAGNEFAVSVCDDAMIAAAFGMIKIHGFCDPKTRVLALKAIERERLPAVLEHRGWRDPEERLEGLGLMEQCLLRTPQIPG